MGLQQCVRYVYKKVQVIAAFISSVGQSFFQETVKEICFMMMYIIWNLGKYALLVDSSVTAVLGNFKVLFQYLAVTLHYREHKFGTDN